MRTSEQTTTLIAALVVARGQFAPIVRAIDAQVGTRAIKYADLAGVLDAITNPLLANGLVLLQSIDAETSSLVTRLAHTSGEWVDSIYPLKIDANPQDFGKALTYGRRYSITSLLCLAAADEDGTPARAKATPPPAASSTVKPKPDLSEKRITEKQVRRMYVIASNAGWTSDQVRTYLVRHAGLENPADIRASQYDALCDVFGTPYEPNGDPGGHA